MKYLDFSPAKESDMFIDSENNTWEVSKELRGAIQTIQDFKTEDRLKLVGLSDRAINEYISNKSKDLKRDVLQLLFKDKWKWTETGEIIEIDDEFINEFLGQKIKLNSLKVKLKEGRLPFPALVKIKSFFINNDSIKKVQSNQGVLL